MANGYLNRADEINYQDVNTVWTRGFARVCEGNVKNALQEFDNAILKTQDIASMLGKASILFQQNKVLEALQLYRKVI